MKFDNQRLPRIDILNFLSKYVGYNDWNHLKYQNSYVAANHNGIKDNPNKVFFILTLLSLLVLLIFYYAFSALYTQEYTFCFYDSDTK